MEFPFRIAGTGCCLVDRIYPHINFRSSVISPMLSRETGDGGISPGKLVFADRFESFTGLSLEENLSKLADLGTAHRNIGGPSMVSLIHASQLLSDRPVDVRFHGILGNDADGRFLRTSMAQYPGVTCNFRMGKASTPSTMVLSDPEHNHGHGERAFINDIGSAWEFKADALKKQFFEADLVAFGGTALVPHLHDALPSLLRRAQEAGAFTLVNTVYDFRSELENPGMPWNLGGPGAWPHIDLLICDRDEALHLSAQATLKHSADFFMDTGVGAFLITNGTEEGLAWSGGGRLKSLDLFAFPVSSSMLEELQDHQGGDTTGCGDNFAGGVLASLAWQLMDGRTPDLKECVAWGSVSGGMSCFHVGGCVKENEKGEKRTRLQPYYQQYIQQIHG